MRPSAYRMACGNGRWQRASSCHIVSVVPFPAGTPGRNTTRSEIGTISGIMFRFSVRPYGGATRLIPDTVSCTTSGMRRPSIRGFLLCMIVLGLCTSTYAQTSFAPTSLPPSLAVPPTALLLQKAHCDHHYSQPNDAAQTGSPRGGLDCVVLGSACISISPISRRGCRLTLAMIRGSYVWSSMGMSWPPFLP